MSTHKNRGTILLIHGVKSDERTWRKLKIYLNGKGFNVITFTLPRDISTHKPDPYRAARHIKRRLQYRKIQLPIILIGHSFGGLIAKAFLLEYREEYDIPVLITLATPHKGVRWGRKALSLVLKQFGGLRKVDKLTEKLTKYSIYKLAQTFSYNSKIIQDLNRAFDIKSVKFFLIGAENSTFRDNFLTRIGDGVVELESQIPPEFIERENVEYFVFYNVSHTQIHKTPAVRGLIYRFLMKAMK